MRTHRARSLLAAAVVALTLSACGGDDSEDSAQQSADPANPHAGMVMDPAVKGDGLKQAFGGYSLVKVGAPEKAGEESVFTFTINGPNGTPHKEFVLELGELMHTYIVRKDLTEFQHVHPTMDAETGQWSIPLTFAKPGPYRLVTEFEALTPDGNFDPRVLGTDFEIKGSYEPVTFTANAGRATVNGYEVTLDPKAMMHGPDMTLKITKGGSDVTDLQPYLQSWAHITGFRNDDLKVVHMHPQQSPGKDTTALGGPTLNLAALFGAPGTYRLFVQFQTADTLHTTPIDIEVMDHQMGGSATQAPTHSAGTNSAGTHSPTHSPTHSATPGTGTPSPTGTTAADSKHNGH